jgi:hypothetical protein
MNIRHPWALAALSVVVIGSSSLAHAAPVSGQGTWETTLQGRDLDGDLTTIESFYDTALDITWLANANAGVGSTYDELYDPTDGFMTWDNANNWVDSLTLGGYTNWRLPTTIDADGPDADTLGNDGCNFTPSQYQGLDCGYNISVHSEMSHMYYVTLGDKAYYSTTGTGRQPGWGLTNTGHFYNVVDNGGYWSATEVATDTRTAWAFAFEVGYQGGNLDKTYGAFSWAVHSGDVGAATLPGATVVPIPIPAPLWLFGSGLIGLLGMSRIRQR